MWVIFTLRGQYSGPDKTDFFVYSCTTIPVCAMPRPWGIDWHENRFHILRLYVSTFFVSWVWRSQHYLQTSTLSLTSETAPSWVLSKKNVRLLVSWEFCHTVLIAECIRVLWFSLSVESSGSNLARCWSADCVYAARWGWRLWVFQYGDSHVPFITNCFRSRRGCLGWLPCQPQSRSWPYPEQQDQ